MGLGFTVHHSKPQGFLGQSAYLRQKEDMKTRGGLPNRLVQVLVLDPVPLMYHGEGTPTTPTTTLTPSDYIPSLLYDHSIDPHPPDCIIRPFIKLIDLPTSFPLSIPIR